MISFERLHSAWNDLPRKEFPPFQIGPLTFGLSSTDELFAKKLLRAFSHLPKNEPDLEIRIWSGHKLPPLDWEMIAKNGYRGTSDHPFYFHYFAEIEALSASDLERKVAYFAIRNPNSLPWWFFGSPFQAIFNVCFRHHNLQLTHAASISRGQKAILLAGKGGSGKSTTVLSCLNEGLHSLGEDYVVLDSKAAYSVYQTAKWEKKTRSFFPSYESHIANPEKAESEKALLYLQDLFPSQLALSAKIHAVVSLSVGSSLRLQKTEPRSSLQSLLLSTAMQLPHPSPTTARLLQQFVEPLEHYRLTLGPNCQENVSLLRSLL